MNSTRPENRHMHPWGGSSGRRGPLFVASRYLLVLPLAMLAVSFTAYADDRPVLLTSDSEGEPEVLILADTDPKLKDLADEYLTILEELQMIIEDYAEYYSELEVKERKLHPISFGKLKRGLKSGRYTESHDVLKGDLTEFIKELSVLEEKTVSGRGENNKAWRRLVRNLAREMSMLVDFIADYQNRIETNDIYLVALQEYLDKASKERRIVIQIETSKIDELLEQLEDLEGIESLAVEDLLEELQAVEELKALKLVVPSVPEIPLVPGVPLSSYPPKKLPRVPDIYVGEDGEVTVGLRKRGYGRELSATATVSDDETPITIIHPSGNVLVGGWNRDVILAKLQLEVSADKRSKEEKFAESAELQIKRLAKGYIVNVRVPKISDPDIKLLSSVLSIRLPMNNPVECRNSFGQLVVADMSGGLRTFGENSEVYVSNVTGSVTAQNSSGPMTFSSVVGNIDALNNNGIIYAVNCSGKLEFKNEYAPIALVGCEGSTRIGNIGVVTVQDHLGDVIIDNSRGHVAVEDLEGNLEASNLHHPLRAWRISGSAQLSNLSADIDIRGIKGSLTVINKHGQITGEDLNGPLKINSYDGDVTVKLNHRLGGPSTITADNSTVLLSVRDRADVLLLASTKGGTIKSSLPVDRSAEKGIETAVLKFGRGSDSLEVSGQNASIHINPGP
ncbi:MAG: hypothetical protein JSU65_01645 [Candidatus Zixiibacteriota bacterium]|nr:MAG: hypothetical protein JSU65_01645 [candidate division Zixibacteria bacterium]